MDYVDYKKFKFINLYLDMQ